MDNEVKNVIDKFKEVKNILKGFVSKDEVVESLMKETKLPKEECSNVYDTFIKIED